MQHASPSILARRDRIAILFSLAGLTALAWVYLVRSAGSMTGGSYVMEMVRMRAWAPADFFFIFSMWAIMMVGMMVPTATPTTMIYAAVVRKAARDKRILAPTAVFVAGYVAMWALFSVAATGAQWGLDQAALLSPMMVANSPALGATLLLAAGIYQLTPLKRACLAHCRSPAHFISEHWRPGGYGAFRMGLEHGVFCLGCCWALMGLLFVGGVMNLLWIAAIAVFVLLEKVVPHALAGGKLAGGGMIVAGFVLLLVWVQT